MLIADKVYHYRIMVSTQSVKYFTKYPLFVAFHLFIHLIGIPGFTD